MAHGQTTFQSSHDIHDNAANFIGKYSLTLHTKTLQDLQLQENNQLYLTKEQPMDYFCLTAVLYSLVAYWHAARKCPALN